MKSFIVTCLKEYQDEVYRIFEHSGITVFSATDIIGFKDNQKPNLLEDWFASGDEKFDSLLIFSFTTGENAEKALGLIMKYNEDRKTRFPLRAFIMPVEKSSY
ncbi:MAG: hypothetical protein ABIN36_12635 [Ferruginibacter sp.]